MTKIQSLMKSRLSLSIAAFLIPLFYCIEIQWIGRLYLNELLLLILLPILLLHRSSLLARRQAMTILLLLGAWLLAQIVTDIIRDTEFSNYARGWSKIIFTAINFCAMYMLVYKSRSRIFFMSCGLALGGILHATLSDNPSIRAIPWQLGYGWGVTWLLVATSVLLNKDRTSPKLWLSILPVLIASVLNFYMGFRSMGGILFITTCYLAFQCIQKHPTRTLNIKRTILICIFGIIAAICALKAYEYSARNGWLGSRELHRIASQANGAYGLLLGGRFEIAISSRVVAQSPWIGQGSWAQDCRYRDLYNELKRAAGYLSGPWESCVIPSHSYLMGAWVETGIFGALVWIAFAVMAVWVLLRIHIRRDRLAPLVIFAALAMLWDIAFSPFAGAARFMLPFAVILLIAHLPDKRFVLSNGLAGRNNA